MGIYDFWLCLNRLNYVVNFETFVAQLSFKINDNFINDVFLEGAFYKKGNILKI